MDFFKKIYPRSFERSTVTRDFVITLVIYVVINMVFDGAAALLGFFIPEGIFGKLISFSINSVASLVSVYCTGGIVFSILKFTKVIK